MKSLFSQRLSGMLAKGVAVAALDRSYLERRETSSRIGHNVPQNAAEGFGQGVRALG